MESQRIAACLLNYVSRHHECVGPLFDLLTIFNAQSRVDFSFVVDFLRDKVAEFSVQEKNKVRGGRARRAEGVGLRA